MNKENNLIALLLCTCTVVLTATAGCKQETKEPAGPPAVSPGGVLAATTVLATIGEGEKVVLAGSHGAPVGFSGILFSEQGGGVAYTEEKDGLFRIVHNSQQGKLYKRIEGLALSPDGSRTAFVAQVGEKYCVVADGKEGKLFDNVGNPRFSPDSRHIVYNATDRDRAYLVADEAITGPFSGSWDELFSGDSSRVISIQNSADHDTVHSAVIYDLQLKNRRAKKLDAILFVYNKNRNRIAAIGLNNGKQQLIDLVINDVDAVNKGQLYDEIYGHSFGPDDVSVAYVAVKGGKLAVVLNGKEEMLPDGSRADPPVIRPDGKATGLILADKDGFFFYQAFASGNRKSKRYQEAAEPVYSSDGKNYAYVAKQGKHVFAVVNGKEGPAFDMVITPAFSPGGDYLVYRARKNGKRFVVVEDADGNVLRRHPVYEQVYQPVFTADGRSVAYGVKDGNKLIWKVEKL